MTELNSAEAAIVKRLDRSFAQSMRTRDALFDMVARVGRAQVPMAIGMLIDGTIIRGAIVPTAQFGDRADAGFARALQAIGTADETLQPLASSFSKLIQALDEQRKRGEEVVQEAADNQWNTFDDIPLDKVIDLVLARQARDFIELSDVSLEARTGIVKLGAMRVSVDHVAAWWPLDSETNATVTYVGAARRAVDAGQ